MKTNIKYLLALTLLPLSALADFIDVDSSYIYYDGVLYVQEEGIVSGYKDGSYRPEQSINRVELTKMVVEANFDADVIDSCVSTRFSDVNAETDWFTPYVCVATANDIVGGYPDGTFRPSRNINIAEASKIILKSFGHNISTGEEVWFRPFIEGLANHNAIPTSIEDYDSFLTRGEMAEIIYRLRANITDKSSQAYSSNGLVIKESAPLEPSVLEEEEEEETLAEEELTESTEETQTNTQEEETITPETQNTETTQNSSDAQNQTTVEVLVSTGTNVSYGSYSQTAFENAINNSHPVALFFHADWCPQCRAADANITQRLSELPDNSIVLKVDFDTEAELRSKYKVTQQHTAVIFNAQGQKAKSVGFSFDDLKVGLQ